MEVTEMIKEIIESSEEDFNSFLRISNVEYTRLYYVTILHRLQENRKDCIYDNLGLIEKNYWLWIKVKEEKKRIRMRYTVLTVCVIALSLIGVYFEVYKLFS